MTKDPARQRELQPMSLCEPCQGIQRNWRKAPGHAELMQRGLSHLRDVTRAILDENRLGRVGQSLRPEDLEVIMVNPLKTKDSLNQITAFEDRFRQEYFPDGIRSIILDKELSNLFAVRVFPTYVWITPGGMVQTITFWNFLNKDAEMRFHRGKGL